MKKRTVLIPVCVITLILACFLFAGHMRRNEISDIFARQISIDENADADTWINSSDTTYNWVHRSLDFSIGVDSQKASEVSAVFVFTCKNQPAIKVHTVPEKLKTDDEMIFTSSIPYRKLSKGTWLMSAYLLDSENHRITLKNPDSADSLAICTFHVR